MRRTILPLFEVSQYSKETILISKEKIANIPIGGVFDTFIGGTFLTKQAGVAINTLEDVIVSPNSDIIVKVDRMAATGIFWPKADGPNFHRTIPMDWNLVLRGKVIDTDEPIEIFIPEKIDFVKGRFISLLATHDWHWGHSIIEHLPALAWCIRNRIQGDLIISDKTDQTIIEIIHILLNYEAKRGAPQRKVLRVPEHKYVMVEHLCVLPRGSIVSNHANSVGILDNIISDWAIDSVDWLRSVISSEISPKKVYGYKKVFLARPGHIRSALNEDRVIDEVEKRGYMVVRDSRSSNGKLLSLAEKIELFNCVSLLTGIAGSAFFNALFIREEFTGLMIGPSNRAGEFITSARLFSHSRMEFFAAIEASGDPHSDFLVPMGRLTAALDEMNDRVG